MHNGIQVLREYHHVHNGVPAVRHGYYGSDFTTIFEANLGVHEAAEERLFGEVLKFMPRGAVMLELGSYWAFYSTWFGRAVARPRLLCVEGEPHNLALGRRNAARNGVLK